MIESYSRTLATTLMLRFPDPDMYPYRSWCYAQGFMLWGFIRLFEKTGEQKYADYVLHYADEHVALDDTISGYSGDSLDDTMAGSVLVWAYLHTGEERYRRACRNVRRGFDDYPRTPDGAFWHARGLTEEFWVDGVFMGGMFLTAYGRYIADSKYCFAEVARQIELIYDCCRKGETGLLYHAYSYDRKQPWADPITGCSPEVWSEGLGWYALILAQALGVLPEDHDRRPRLIRQYTELLESLKSVQDEKNGLWYQVVDKAGHYDNWQDTSGSAMFAYSILRAIRMGVVDEQTYMPCVHKAYEGLKTKVTITADGLMDIHDACKGLCVQTHYDKYVYYKRVVNAQEAVAAMLWFTVEYEQK